MEEDEKLSLIADELADYNDSTARGYGAEISTPKSVFFLISKLVNIIGNQTIEGIKIFTGLRLSNIAKTFNVIFNAESLTADRTVTWPDVTGNAAVSGMTTAFQFGGQAQGGYSVESFSATKTFNLNNGNSQEMVLTGNVTSLTLSNKVNGGSYLIYLIQDGTGSRTIPAPDSTFGNKTDNSVADFVTAANTVNIINVNVRPNGTTYWTLETYTP